VKLMGWDWRHRVAWGVDWWRRETWPERCGACLGIGLLVWYVIAIVLAGYASLTAPEDPAKVAARLYRDRFLSECVRDRLDPRVAGYRFLPKTLAGINKATDDCWALLDAAIEMAGK